MSLLICIIIYVIIMLKCIRHDGRGSKLRKALRAATWPVNLLNALLDRIAKECERG